MLRTCLMEPRGVRVTMIAYFSLFTHTKQLLLSNDILGYLFRNCKCYRTPTGWTDVNVEIFMLVSKTWFDANHEYQLGIKNPKILKTHTIR